MTFVVVLLCLNFAQAVNQKNTTSLKIDLRIVGGQIVTKREDFSYQASIRIQKRHFCGGAIITSQHIVTAAHCCFDRHNQPIKPKYYTVVVGDLNIFSNTIYTVVRNVVAIKYHEDYDSNQLKNDVAVMKLDKRFKKWTPFIQNINLATTSPIAGAMCTISGWGKLKEDGSISAQLQMLLLPIIAQATCIEMHKYRIKDGMFCAGYIEGGKDSCEGDSGGPLACDGVLYGLVSWGYGCAVPRKVGVYADVGYYRKWILEKGLTASTDSLHNQRSSCILLDYKLPYVYGAKGIGYTKK